MTKAIIPFFTAALFIICCGNNENASADNPSPIALAVAETFVADTTGTAATTVWKGVLKMNEAELNEKVLKREGVTVVDFSAEWCGPCHALEPILKSIAKDYEGKVGFANIDVDENNNLAAELGISSIPYIAFYKNGKLVKHLVGVQSKAKLKKEINKLLK